MDSINLVIYFKEIFLFLIFKENMVYINIVYSFDCTASKNLVINDYGSFSATKVRMKIAVLKMYYFNGELILKALMLLKNIVKQMLWYAYNL